MLRLPYRPEQFGLHMGSALTQVSELKFTWDELVRAAITVGRRNWNDVLRHGTYSVLEALWRVAILRANLVEDPDGRLGKSDAFVSLDPSERGAVSYFLGLAFTKLVAEKLFGVPWLLHLDVYKKDLNPHLALTVKPDFVGMDVQQQWLVAESKARTGPISAKALRDAKRQTRSLRNVNGQLPALRIAVGTYFSSARCRARIWDPDGFDDGAIDLEVSSEEFARAYYRPIVEVIEELSKGAGPVLIDGESVRRVELSGFDATVGVDGQILSWYRGDGPTWKEILEARRAVPSVLGQIAELQRTADAERAAIVRGDPAKREILGRRLEETSAMGVDGVTVELGPSWSEEYMRRQPQDRGR